MIAAAKKNAWKPMVPLVALAFIAYGCFVPFPPPHHPKGYDDLMTAIASKDPTQVKAVLDRGVNPNT